MGESPIVSTSVAHDDCSSALHQIAERIVATLPPIKLVHIHPSGFSAAMPEDTEEHPVPGILAVNASLDSESVLHIVFDLAAVPKDSLHISQPYPFFRDLGSLEGPACGLSLRYDGAKDRTILSVELLVQATLLGPSREAALIKQVTSLRSLAQQFLVAVPQKASAAAQGKMYDKFKGRLTPVSPLSLPSEVVPPEHRAWALRALDFLSGSLSLALTCPYPPVELFVLALLASEANKQGATIGRVCPDMIPPHALRMLAEEAPGTLAVGARQLFFGSHAYGRAALVESMIENIKPVIFFGGHSQLQTVFGGEQGTRHSPLVPVVLHAPVPSLELLAEFVLHEACLTRGVPKSEEQKMRGQVLHSLDRVPESDRIRLLPVLTERTVHSYESAARGALTPLPDFARQIAQASETFGGLNPSPSGFRSDGLQQRLTEVINGDRLLVHLKENLLCQDRALNAFAGRVRSEVLTRESAQPLRLCLQGTPGCGKSKSAELLADLLGIPFVTIDCASMPDAHTAISQLLGSGRGIVHSERPGRLEEAANHSVGAVLEVADLDHAPPSTRSTMAEVFLQALQTGEAQSAMGSAFSLSNLIIVFTMNLPDGADEGVRKAPVGFNGTVTEREVRANVIKHMKAMLSGAFVSRVGSPILFDPLNGDALATIAVHAVQAALPRAASRLGIDVGPVEVPAGVAQRLVALAGDDIPSFGARALVDSIGERVSECAVRNTEILREADGCALRFSFNDLGSLVLEVEAVRAGPS